MLLGEARTLDGRPLADENAARMLREHACEVYPHEALGYIHADGSYRPLVNVSPNPDVSAFPDRNVFAYLLSQDLLRALCHSHPNGPDCPSENDMRAQIELEVPFVLVSSNGSASTEPFAWGDQLLDDRDIVGRPFRHAVDDCYGLIRNWYRLERDVLLPEFPRNWEWWVEGTPGEKDLYRRHFSDAEFYQIDIAQARPGDVWLAALRSSVPNHAGIVLEGGLALHHPSSGLAYDPSRLSKRDSLARWSPYITHWLRRD